MKRLIIVIRKCLWHDGYGKHQCTTYQLEASLVNGSDITKLQCQMSEVERGYGYQAVGYYAKDLSHEIAKVVSRYPDAELQLIRIDN